MYPEFPYLGYKDKLTKIPIAFPPQIQNEQPGIEAIMQPLPIFDNTMQRISNKLQDKVAIITGGDSGIGRAIAVLFAKEGANIVIVYLSDRETEDANFTKHIVEQYGRTCLNIQADLRDSKNANQVAQETIDTFDKIDILVNNCGFQMNQDSILDISDEQLRNTFETNVFSFFYMTRATLPYLKPYSSIINTSSVNSFKGNKILIDYSASKGEITAFTKSMSASLVKQKIRVNEVAPGPIWTPFIPSGGYTKEQIELFGTDVPMERAGQPFEVSPAYLYLASDDSRYVTGQTINVNGGTIV